MIIYPKNNDNLIPVLKNKYNLREKFCFTNMKNV
jgi:hypothetical protein